MKNSETLFCEWAADEVRFDTKGNVLWTREEMDELAFMLTGRDEEVKPKEPGNVKAMSAAPISLLLTMQEEVTNLTRIIYTKRPDLLKMRGIWIAQFESWDEFARAVESGYDKP